MGNLPWKRPKGLLANTSTEVTPVMSDLEKKNTDGNPSLEEILKATLKAVVPPPSPLTSSVR